MRIITHWLVLSVVLAAVVMAVVPLVDNGTVAKNRANQQWQGELTDFQKSLNRVEQPIPTVTPTSTPQPVRILVAGDLMFDRHIRQHAEKNGNDFVFTQIADFLRSADAVLANLEGPITTFNSKSVGSVVGSPNNYLFTFPVSLAQTLQDHRITIVSLGNNHILNFGQTGLEQTRQILTEHSISYFGHVSNSDTSVPISLIKDIGDSKFGFVNYNQFSAQQSKSAIDEIARIKNEVDYVVVYAHWDNEYQSRPARPTVELAHAMIDAGADIVIGSHPHVIQVNEEYEGKMIYYSLGNFIFDQYFEPAVKKGMILELIFTPNSPEIVVNEHSIEMLTNGQTRLVSE